MTNPNQNKGYNTDYTTQIDGKIHCTKCDKTMLKSSWAKHTLTKKHTGEEQATDSDRDTYREKWNKYASNMKEKDHVEWKKTQALKRWRFRNPDKDISEYKPRSQASVNLSKTITNNITKLVTDEVKQKKENKEPVDIPALKKIIKEKVVTETFSIKNLKTRDSLINELVKVSKQKNKDKASLTAVDNVNRVNNLHKYMTGNDWNYYDLKWLEDTDKVFNFVSNRSQWKSSKTKSNQYASIAAILRHVDDDKYSKFFKIYSRLATNIQNKIDEDNKEGKLKPSEKLKILRWDNVIDIGPKLSDSNGGNSFLRALYAMYVKIPPRRGIDYRLMKIIRNDKVKYDKLNHKFNYLIINHNTKMPIEMRIYNYKEAPRRSWAKKKNNSGEYILNPIPSSLARTLQEYIIDEKLKSNDFLFGLDTNHEQHYPDGSFSTLVSKNLFEAFAGVNMGINDLRKSYASWYMPILHTYKEKEDLSFSMGSSVGELSSTYHKTDLMKPD